MATLSTAQLSTLMVGTHQMKGLGPISSSISSSSSSSSSLCVAELVNVRSSNCGISQHQLHLIGSGLRQSDCYGSRHRSANFEELLQAGRRGFSHVVHARKRDKNSTNGGLVQAVEEVRIPERDEEPDNMFMGQKLDGYEPDFWEGEKWNLFGFLMQYLWAFGILIAVVACAVAVASYNSGAVDIRDTSVFKEALENPLESGSSLDTGEDSEASPFE